MVEIGKPMEGIGQTEKEHIYESIYSSICVNL